MEGDAAAPPVRRRGAISAEPSSSAMESTEKQPEKKEKDEKTYAYLEKVLHNNILFSHLEASERKDLFGYMSEVRKNVGDVVIEQGDPSADSFYVVDSGELDVYKDYHDGKDPVKVYEYGPGGFFGELALMYNTPRAATVKARTDVRLWALDRVTFRKVLMDRTKQKRELYQSFLTEVPLLANLDKYERLTIADALETEYCMAGEEVIKEGDKGDKFYLVVEGTVKVTKQGKETPNSPLKPGQYFGELALMSDEVRQATITANEDVKLASLDRDAFTRLLGPCKEIMERNREGYKDGE